MAILVALLTFVVATLVCLLVWFSFASMSGQEVVQRRLQAVEKAERRGTSDVGVQLLRDELMSGVPALNRAMMRWSWSTRFKEYVAQAGLQTRPGKFVLTSGVLALLG